MPWMFVAMGQLVNLPDIEVVHTLTLYWEHKEWRHIFPLLFTTVCICITFRRTGSASAHTPTCLNAEWCSTDSAEAVHVSLLQCSSSRDWYLNPSSSSCLLTSPSSAPSLPDCFSQHSELPFPLHRHGHLVSPETPEGACFPQIPISVLYSWLQDYTT